MKAPMELDSHSAGSISTLPSDTSGAPWAVVPVKGFRGAKRRLEAVLAESARADLAEIMMRHVVRTLIATTELGGVLVVTSDRDAAALARNLGADVIDDPCASGTNAAVEEGLKAPTLRKQAAAVVVPGDLPLLTCADMREVLARGRDCPVVLVPAARDGGTNLLLTRPPSLLKPSFGPGSFARHVATARELEIEPCVLQLEAIGLDIDNPDDLAALMSMEHCPSTCVQEILSKVSAIATASARS